MSSEGVIDISLVSTHVWYPAITVCACHCPLLPSLSQDRIEQTFHEQLLKVNVPSTTSVFGDLLNEPTDQANSHNSKKITRTELLK